MHRQWDSEKCCISTSFAQSKIRTLHTYCFKGGNLGLRFREKLPKESVSIYHKSNAKPGLWLKEKVKKEYVSRNYKSISEELPVLYPQVLRS